MGPLPLTGPPVWELLTRGRMAPGRAGRHVPGEGLRSAVTWWLAGGGSPVVLKEPPDAVWHWVPGHGPGAHLVSHGGPQSCHLLGFGFSPSYPQPRGDAGVGGGDRLPSPTPNLLKPVA